MVRHTGRGAAHGMSQTMVHAGPIDREAHDGLRIAALYQPPGELRRISARRKKLPSVTTLSPGFKPLSTV